jgi:hypothetical protein
MSMSKQRTNSWLDISHVRVEIVDGARIRNIHCAGSAHNGRTATLELEDLLSRTHGATDGVNSSGNIDRDGV